MRHVDASATDPRGPGEGDVTAVGSADSRPPAADDSVGTAEPDASGAPAEAIGPVPGGVGAGEVGLTGPGVGGTTGAAGEGATVGGVVGAGVGGGGAVGAAVGDGDVTGDTSTDPASSVASPLLTVARNVTGQKPAGSVDEPE